MRNLVVDGMTHDGGDGDFQGDGEFLPFVVFDADQQKNITGPFGIRADAEKMRNLLSRRVVCAALQLNDSIICGARHFDGVMVQQIIARGEDWRRAEQGFINTWGEFLTREEAWDVADENGQIIGDRNWFPGALHSEHLY